MKLKRQKKKTGTNLVFGYIKIIYSVLKKSRSARCCSSVSLVDSISKSLCRGVNVNESELFEKNCASVIPNASQIFSKEGMVGSIFLRYQDEIVDCVKPDFSAS